MRYKIFKPTLILFLIFSGFQSVSQTLNDPIFINFQFQPNSTNSLDSNLTATKQVEINLTSPAIKINKKLNWYHAVYFRNTNFENTESVISNNPQNIFDLRYSNIFRYQLDSTWELIGLPRVLIRSDFSASVTSKDIFPYMVLLANYSVNKNPNFKIGLGIALNNDFSPNAIIPTGTLFYNSKKYRVEISYPTAYILYKSSKNCEFGIYGNLDASISHFKQSTSVEYIKSVQYFISPTIVHRLHKQFFTHLKIGYASERKFQYLDVNFNSISNLENNLEPNVFFKLGFSYRI